MCRSITDHGDSPPLNRDRLSIDSFHLRLALAAASERRRLPEALTLVYLPRAKPLEVNGARARPNAPSFVALHRTRSAERGGEAVFASTDRVVASEGVEFEAYLGEERVLKGAIRRDGGGGGGAKGWGVELRRGGGAEMVAEVEVGVCVEGGVGVVGERMKVAPPPARRQRRGFCLKLEEIPEEEDGCDCSCCECEGGEDEEEGWEVVGSECGDVDVDVEGVNWAVDVGIWAVCLGVGLLVSSSWRRRRRTKLI